jgi:S1-C subfamily serine protease
MFSIIQRFTIRTTSRSLQNVNYCRKYLGSIATSENFNENHHNSSRNYRKYALKGVLLAATIPIVHKSSEDDESKGKSNRDRFNFIADIAEMSFPSIVQVEVLAMGPFHSVLVSGGSGFIISDDGIILTNAHVLRDRNNVTIKLNDGRKFNGKVIKVDQLRDIAAVKINCVRTFVSLKDISQYEKWLLYFRMTYDHWNLRVQIEYELVNL